METDEDDEETRAQLMARKEELLRKLAEIRGQVRREEEILRCIYLMADGSKLPLC